MPPPPQPPPRLRPRKGRVLHAQSAYRTYICSNLNLCTLPIIMSLSPIKKKDTTIVLLQQQHNISTVLRKKNQRKYQKKKFKKLNKKKWQQRQDNKKLTKKTKQSLRGIIKFQYYLHQNVHNRHDFYFIVSPIVSSITSIITSKTKQTKKEKEGKKKNLTTVTFYQQTLNRMSRPLA